MKYSIYMFNERVSQTDLLEIESVKTTSMSNESIEISCRK